MLELTLPTSGSTLDILVILDALDVEISPFLGFDALDGKNLVDIVTNHLWNSIATNRDPP